MDNNIIMDTQSMDNKGSARWKKLIATVLQKTV